MKTRKHAKEVLPGLIAAGAAVGIQDDTKLNSAAILLDAESTEIRKVAKRVEISYNFASDRLGLKQGYELFSSVQFSSVTQSCPPLCYSMNRSTPGLPVHHQLPEFTQTHVHRVSDAIQPSHSLSSPSPPAPNPSQHQSLFQWVNSSHEVAKVLDFQLSYHSFQRNPRADLLHNGLVGSPCSPRDSQESSPTPQFKSISSLTLSLLHSPTLTSIHDHRKSQSLD